MKYIKMAASSNFGNMFSVVGASAFLPFLPMLPIQVLTNNLLYDFSQTTIPTDQVDGVAGQAAPVDHWQPPALYSLYRSDQLDLLALGILPLLVLGIVMHWRIRRPRAENEKRPNPACYAGFRQPCFLLANARLQANWNDRSWSPRCCSAAV